MILQTAYIAAVKERLTTMSIGDDAFTGPDFRAVDALLDVGGAGSMLVWEDELLNNKVAGCGDLFPVEALLL